MVTTVVVVLTVVTAAVEEVAVAAGEVELVVAVEAEPHAVASISSTSALIVARAWGISTGEG